MGRKKSTDNTAPVELAPLPAEQIARDQNLMAERSAEIMAKFGDGLPYDQERIVHEARFYMAQSAEAMLEAGKRLVLLKEHEPHGRFIAIVTEKLGLGERTAQMMMQAAIKYLSPKLQEKAQTFALLGKSKLFELMVEDDEALAALANGGSVAGLKLDDVDRMSVRELRVNLREARADAEAHQQLLADKNSKIDELAARLNGKERKVNSPAWDEQGELLRKEVAGYAFAAEAAVRGELQAGFDALIEHGSGHATDHTAFLAGLLIQVERAIHEVRERHHLPAAIDGDLRPEWVRDLETES